MGNKSSCVAEIYCHTTTKAYKTMLGGGRRETLGLFDEKTVSFSGGVSLENIAVDQVRIGGILKEIVGRLDFFSYQCDFMGEIRV